MLVHPLPPPMVLPWFLTMRGSREVKELTQTTLRDIQ